MPSGAFVVVVGASGATDSLPAPGGNDAGALLLARLRACGHVDRSVAGSAMNRAVRAAAAVDRRLGEMTDAGGQALVVRGWADGAAPNPDLHPSASLRTLGPVANLVWAACVAAAWPDPAASPVPGRTFSRRSILAICVGLAADKNTVVAALDTALPNAGLITLNGDCGALGPAAAALPSATWSQIRRIHDRLPRGSESDPRVADDAAPVPQSPASAVRWVAVESPVPASEFDDSVRKIVCALETAEEPIRRGDLPTLADPAVRGAVEATLAQCGRTLISLGSHGWITGYPTAIAETLAKERFGILEPTERAILALVLLHTVAIPRARGMQLDDTWASSHPVQKTTLLANRKINRKVATAALRGLRRAGFIVTANAGGLLPGPAMLRLTSTQRNLLWEDLIVLGRPNGYMAQRIREQRSHRLT